MAASAAIFISKIMNLCKNCKHYISYDKLYDRCKKYVIRTDQVTGDTIYHSCHKVRFLSNLCGHEGKDFDPKPTLIQRIKLYLAPTAK